MCISETLRTRFRKKYPDSVDPSRVIRRHSQLLMLCFPSTFRGSIVTVWCHTYLVIIIYNETHVHIQMHL